MVDSLGLELIVMFEPLDWNINHKWIILSLENFDLTANAASQGLKSAKGPQNGPLSLQGGNFETLSYLSISPYDLVPNLSIYTYTK